MGGPPVYVVSGGMGTSGEHLVRTALAQFESNDVRVIIVSNVEHVDRLDAIAAKAGATGGIIVHTLVDAHLRDAMIERAREHNTVAIDLMGPLLLHLTRVLGQKPLGQPGLYRQLREDYFTRIEAIEFTVEHDDGCRPHELGLAQIVLAGVSRSGKTPLSMYLSTRGWKVANVPLIPEVTPPEELFQIDARRVVGLDIEPEHLLAYRQHRQRGLGVIGRSAYIDAKALLDEVDYARTLCRRHGFTMVNVTDKPIEESANEVIAHLQRRFDA